MTRPVWPFRFLPPSLFANQILVITLVVLFCDSDRLRAQTGACCNYFSGQCYENVGQFVCGAEEGWFLNTACADINPPCEILEGACCDRSIRNCVDFLQTQQTCSGPALVFVPGTHCYDVACTGVVTYYVDPQTTGSVKDGATWCTSFATLEEAFAVTLPGDRILVARGTFTPSIANLVNPRDATFRIPDRVQILGGFAGCKAPNPDQRDLRAFRTILSCDLNGDDFPDFTGTDENCHRVLTIANTGVGTLLDGIWITGGKDRSGSGLYVVDSHLEIHRCTITRNHAVVPGATGVGSYFSNSVVLIADSVFFANVGVLGSAIASDHESSLVIWNCTIVGNGIPPPFPLAPRGAVTFRAATSTTILNSILWGNTGYSDPERNQIVTSPSAMLDISNSIIEGWTGALGGVGNSGSAPGFGDFDGLDGIVGTPDDDLRLSPESPAMNAGSILETDLDTMADRDGHARVLCGSVDLGAFESGLGDVNCDRRVDLFDWRFFQNCYNGSGSLDESAWPPCSMFDADLDQRIDLSDSESILSEITGP